MDYKYSDDEVKVLLCVAKCGQSLGRSMISEVLRGSHSVRVFSRRLYINSSFGALKGGSEEDVDALIQGLVDKGLLAETEDEFAQVELTEAAKKILHERAEHCEEVE